MKKVFLLSLLAVPTLVYAQPEPVVESPATNHTFNVAVFANGGTAQAVDTRSVTLPVGIARLRLFDLPPGFATDRESQFDTKPPLQILGVRVGTVTLPTFPSNHEIALYDFIGETISLIRSTGTGDKVVSGKLLGVSPVLFDTADGVLFNPAGTWVFPKNSPKLTLVKEPNPPIPENRGEYSEWRVQSGGGNFVVNARYPVNNLRGGVFYKATLDKTENPSLLQLTGYVDFWVSGTAAINATLGADFELVGTGLKFEDVVLSNGDNIRTFLSTSVPVKDSIRFDTGGVNQNTDMARTFSFNENPAQHVLTFTLPTENGPARSLPVGPLTLWYPNAPNAASTISAGIPIEKFDPNNGAIPLGADPSRKVARAVTLNKLLNPTVREWEIQLTVTAGPAMTLVERVPHGTKITKTSQVPTSTTSNNSGDTLIWELPASNDATPNVITYIAQTPA